MRRRQAVPDLAPATIAILLAGWDAYPPGGDDAGDFAGGFLDLYDVGGPARMWRLHERYLRRVAAEWGWLPPAGGQFYGESV